MSRIARVVLPGIPVHITQRGNGRQQVFFDETDLQLYVDLLREHSTDAGLILWAYCLMPNHVHLIGLPSRPESLAYALGRAHANFARHFNLRKRSCGHVWQARFFSCPLDDTYLWRAMAYVERNPVRARIVEHAEDYRWSSATAHLSGSDPAGLIDLSAWRLQYDSQRWKRVLETSVGEEALGQRIHEASLRGRALGNKEFVIELESRAGRRLRPRPAGRPKSKGSEKANQRNLSIGV